MAAKTFKIEFSGHWTEPNKSKQAKSGVYSVHSCIDNVTKNTVSIKKLIYVGESKDVYDRIKNHEKLPDWKKHLNKDEVLCYNFGGVADSDRDRCEAAIIFKHEPPENSEYVDSFPFDQTTMNLSGEKGKLSSSFTVNKT